MVNSGSKLRNLILFFLAGLAGIMLASCKEQNEKKTIDFVYVNWAEGIDMVNVTKVVLENYGYEVNLMNTDVAPLYASLADGEVDVFLESWQPVSDKYYIEKYGKSLESLGVIYDSAMIGFVVPDYVTIDSITQMNQYKDKFAGKVVGIDAGAGSMQATAKAIETYNLDYELMNSSGAGMTATLKKKIDKKEWVVVAGWRPHWMFARWDLKMLKDPKGAFGQQEKIIAVARKGFKADFPVVAKFIENMHYTNAQMGSLMETFEKGDNNIESAKKWIASHKKLVNSWIPDKMKADAEQANAK